MSHLKLSIFDLNFLRQWLRTSWRNLVLALVVFALGCFITWQLSEHVEGWLVNDARRVVEDDLESSGSVLSAMLNQQVDILAGLTAFTTAHAEDGLLPKEFEPFAARLQANDPLIRVIEIFPASGPELFFPKDANSAGLNHTLADLLNDQRPDVSDAVQRAIRTRKAIVGNSVPLAQGGQGVVLHQAVYQDGKLWGFVVLTVNLESMLAVPSLSTDYPDLDIALKDASGRVIYGPEKVFVSDPVFHDVSLPEGSWSIAGLPKTGWFAQIQFQLSLVWFFGLLVSLSQAGLTYLLVRRQSSLVGQVEKRTRELNDSMENYRMLFDQAADGIIISDASGRCVQVNTSFCALLGYTREEILQLNLCDLVVTKEQAELPDETLDSSSGSSVAVYEQSMRRKDGSEVSVELSSRKLPDGRLQSLARDISERKQVEEKNRATQVEQQRLLIQADLSRQVLLSLVEDQKKVELALRGSEERYRTLVDVSPDAIFVNRQDKIVFINSAGLDLLGANAPDQILGKSTLGIFHPDSQADILERLKQLFPLLKATGPVEEEIVRLDGQVRAVEVAAAPIDDNGVVNVQVVMRDITERKQAETELRQAHAELEQRVIERTYELKAANHALERAARLKDEFLASMSHELRTPLTGILGLAEALQMVTYGELNERQRHALKNIETSGRHLLVLINDILDLSKIEAGRFELQLETCLLGEICQGSLQLTKGMATQKRQMVSFDMEPASIVLLADVRRLKQMIVNLLSNAIKFTPEGGSLGIEIKGNVLDRELKITVWDKGIGIHPDDLPRLFQPFVQLESSLSRQFDGTGLGLSLVHSLAVLHKGHMEVESTYGKGSRFTIVLPWQPEASLPEPPERQPIHGIKGSLGLKLEPPRPGPLVIMADDNDMVLELVSDFLVSRNYRVCTTHGGIEFLERLEQVSADMILMDIQMPGMDGLEVIRHIRAHPVARTAALPVIAVTALAMAGDRERCLAAGANAYLSKPIQLRELIETIERLCPIRD
jgi:PAS domain S-box-containing protein